MKISLKYGSIEFLNLHPSLYTTKMKTKNDCSCYFHTGEEECPQLTIPFQYINIAGSDEDYSDKLLEDLGQLVEQLNIPHSLAFQGAEHLYRAGDLQLNLELF